MMPPSPHPSENGMIQIGMSQGLNPSERFVYSACKASFLSLWSYANPRGEPGKELCDILCCLRARSDRLQREGYRRKQC